MRSISIIIPCFNDENKIIKNLYYLKKKLKKIKIKYELIVINDGSSDHTLIRLKKFKSNKSKLRIINNNKNYGKSYSIRKGLKFSKSDYVILIDSDLPYFSSLNKVLKKLSENFDFVFINRRHMSSHITNKNLNFYQRSRYFIGYLVSLAVRFFLNMNIHGGDTQSGLKGFKKIRNFKKLKFISSKFFLDLEIMYYYNNLNKKFYSVPVKYKIDNNSSIKLFSFKKNFEILIELIKVILHLKK